MDIIDSLRDKIVTRTISGDVVWKRSISSSTGSSRVSVAET
jgi:hypothetical protein